MDEEKVEIQQVTLRVREQNGEEMFFKVKGTTKMQKVFDSYAQRRGVEVKALRFMLDGNRISADDTPKMLELEENDQIDVLLETIGGGLNEDETAPAENQAEAPITLKVRDQSGEEMFFKVKKGTQMKKIMQAFADRKGVSLDVLRFTIDGTRVNAEDTPKMLEMEDGDQIDVLLQQLGGADTEGGAASENQAEAPITLKVRDQSGEEMFFKVKKGTQMKKIMQAFADRKGVSLDVLRFTIDGTRVNAEDTPKMLEMEDGDQIDVLLQQLGGADTEGGAANVADAPITLKVKDQSGEEMFFKVKKGTQMKKIMQAFADRKGISVDVLHFLFDGTRLKDTDTPKMLEMEEGDMLDVVLTQLGGQ